MNSLETDIVFVVVMATVLLALMTGFVFSFIQSYKRRQLIYQNELQRKEQDFAEALLRSRLEISENMMCSLSRELHDNIGQALVGANMQLAVVSADNFADQAATAKGILGRALQDIRDLSKSLNGEFMLREGLQAALEREVALLQNLRKLKCSLSGDSLDRVVSQDAEVMVFRCIQECLGNALKHANASRIDIHSQVAAGVATIDIADNGMGMPPEAERGEGLGLTNLSHRMALIGGEFSIHSPQGEGARMRLTFPLS
jgi:signal transduction histidine kinase